MKARWIACVFVDCLKKSLIFQSLAYVAGDIVWVRDWSFGGGAGFQKKFVGFSLIGWFNWDQLKWQKWAAFEKTWFSGRRYFSRLRRSWQLRRQISLDCITTAPPPNLTRLLHNTASYAGYSKPCSWCQVVRLDLVFRSPAPGNWNWGWAQLCLVSGVGLGTLCWKIWSLCCLIVTLKIISFCRKLCRCWRIMLNRHWRYFRPFPAPAQTNYLQTSTTQWFLNFKF